jgi:hypothetical protein
MVAISLGIRIDQRSLRARIGRVDLRTSADCAQTGLARDSDGFAHSGGASRLTAA